jgi:hypothetical protein
MLQEHLKRVVFERESDIVAALDDDADIPAALSSLDLRPDGGGGWQYSLV